MKLFEEVIAEVRGFVQARRAECKVRRASAGAVPSWPEGERGNVVLRADTAVELGSPEVQSVAFVLWTARRALVQDGEITLVGPDVGESRCEALPFGKVVLVAASGFDADNCCDRHRELELRRFDISLSGHMMRATSQRQREWSRVSRRAVRDGFSLLSLGRRTVEGYRAMDFVDAVEVLFVTSSSDDVLALGALGERAATLLAALQKMTGEPSFDCKSCDYTELCGEVEGLRAMRRALREGRRDA